MAPERRQEFGQIAASIRSVKFVGEEASAAILELLVEAEQRAALDIMRESVAAALALESAEVQTRVKERAAIEAIKRTMFSEGVPGAPR